MSGPCEGCRGPRSTRYLFPDSDLCTPCVSPLCEACGEREARFSAGTGARNIHVCGVCLAAPSRRRLRRVVLLSPPGRV